MSVVCQCPTCQAKYQVGDQYAGRTIKCPKCSAAVVVPAFAQPPIQPGAAAKTSTPGAPPALVSSKVGLPKAQADGIVKELQAKPSPTGSASTKLARAVAISRAEAAVNDRDTIVPPPADDGLGFVAEESIWPMQVAAAPALEVVASEQSSDENESAGDLASIVDLAARSPRAALPRRSKKKKQGFPAWLIPAIAGVGVAGIAGIGAMIYLAGSNSKPAKGSTAGPSTATANGGKTPAKAGKEEPKVPMLTIDWPENQRARAALFVNDERREVPLTGPIEIQLPPSNEQYRFRLERPGFRPKNFARAAGNDDQAYTVSEWEAAVQGFDWEQDFDAAKKTAADHDKNVLILFDASDSKESSFASNRFAEAVALRKEFRDRADREYVCVYIDNPEKEDAQKRVDNAGRNAELTKRFRVTVFPTVVVTDPKGRPFGILEDYKINGVNRFLELMDQWAQDGKTLFELLAKVETMPKESANSDLIEEVFDFLTVNKLDRFYRGKIKELTARLPKGGEHSVTKRQFETWMGRFERATRNPDEAKKVVEAFDEWKKTRTFQDHDIGAKLHLAAAAVLMRLGRDHREEAAEKCKEGLAFDPKDPSVRSYLEILGQALSGKSGVIPAGSGTGFCIAQGNYVLTNHHVIAHAKEIKVHLNGAKERYPAKLVADNEPGDMALLKIDLPTGKKLAPIPLASAGVSTGEEVCALGFPGVMGQNSTLTFTKGVVSTVPDAHNEEELIGTDCKVNPGNSGGPLCNLAGCIAGIVTAKSHINSKEDSYGLVIPVDRVRKFLVKSLPADGRKLAATPAAGQNLKPNEVYSRVGPSVVYIENLQEMRALEQEQEQGE